MQYSAYLTYAAFSNAVVLDEASRQYALEIAKYQNIVITFVCVLAVAEVLFYKKPHSGHSDKSTNLREIVLRWLGLRDVDEHRHFVVA